MVHGGMEWYQQFIVSLDGKSFLKTFNIHPVPRMQLPVDHETGRPVGPRLVQHPAVRQLAALWPIVPRPDARDRSARVGPRRGGGGCVTPLKNAPRSRTHVRSLVRLSRAGAMRPDPRVPASPGVTTPAGRASGVMPRLARRGWARSTRPGGAPAPVRLLLVPGQMQRTAADLVAVGFMRSSSPRGRTRRARV